MQCRPLNAYQEVSNTNHFGSVSDSLGRLSAASECTASDIENININILFCSQADEEMITQREENEGAISACNLLLDLLPRKNENFFSHFVAALHKNGYGRIANEIEPAFRKTRKENVRV